MCYEDQNITTNKWQRVNISASFSCSQRREEPTTKQTKENYLNLQEKLWRNPIELRAEKIPQEEILTVKSRNGRSSCLRILIKINVLKSFAIFTGKHLCWILSLEKVAGLESHKSIKRRLQHRCFLWILQDF